MRGGEEDFWGPVLNSRWCASETLAPPVICRASYNPRQYIFPQSVIISTYASAAGSSLNHALLLGLPKFMTDIDEMSEYARKEYSVERMLDKMQVGGGGGRRRGGGEGGEGR